MIRIANPIYDVVFKYLMSDNKIAKLLLSDLLQTEILELSFQPQEYSTDLTGHTLTVFRIDFKAKIKLQNGNEQVVLIEIQKAKFPTDIMRFRRYLGEQYANKENLDLPIISVYLLGYPLENIQNVPILRVVRKYINAETNEEILAKEGFIESLTHDAIIVQLSVLRKMSLKSELEQILSIFVPEYNKHSVSLEESDYPEKYKPIIRRLLKAFSDEKVKQTMNIEDEILEELAQKERLVKEALLLADKERQKAEQEKRKAEQERQKILQMVKNMQQEGLSKEVISKYTGLSVEELDKLL